MVVASVMPEVSQGLPTGAPGLSADASVTAPPAFRPPAPCVSSS
jgi:hypothetical protein